MVAKKDRASSLTTFTRGSAYGLSGWYRTPMSMIAGSISTAVTDFAPLRSAPATSLPDPGPTTCTACGAG